MSTIGDIMADVQRHGRIAEFARVADRRWVSAPTCSIRQIFEFEAIKGAVFSARWGWSADFVPVLRGRSLSWKRTAEKAQFDLCIDPIDTLGSVPPWGSIKTSDSPARIAKATAAAWEAAQEFWAKVNTLRDLADLFEQRSRMSFRRFSLNDYAQTDLAWGLVLIALGQADAGQRHLSTFCNQFGIDAETPMLTKARDEAAAMSLSGSLVPGPA